MTEIPPAAVTAAVASLSKHTDTGQWLTAAEGTAGGLLARKELLTTAVSAAAPHIAAAERERILLAVRHTCACPQAIRLLTEGATP